MSVDNAFLEKLQSLYPGGRDSPWFVYAGLIFQSNDYMDLVGKTFDFVKDQEPEREPLIVKARKLREAQLKASVLIGFPKVIYLTSSNSTKKLTRAYL